jgi:omega-6 fatty acid desaturase (delta-12 desaturase)
MVVDASAAKTQAPDPNWYRALAKYTQPNPRKAAWQLLDTLGPYVGLWGLMVYLVHQDYAYWMTLAVAMVAGALLIRIFIVFHDCCHGSFVASRRANRILGYVSGILTFTPYEDWRRAHAGHHATAGDLDRRGVGDVWTMAVEEYLAAPRRTRLAYRLFRNPVVMFGLAPVCLSLIRQRFPHKGAGKRERRSVLVTNLAIVAILGAASLTIELRTYVAIQLPIMLIAGTIGMWLFYVQHQFEGVHWARHQDWDPQRAALEGSSYYRLPKVLQWCTGNIGLHHIHHVRPGIPNYHLQQCYDDLSAMRTVEPLTIRRSLKSLRLHLWDEAEQRLVSFRSLQTRPQPHKLGLQDPPRHESRSAGAA